MTVRAFIAVDISGEARDALAEVTKRLQEQGVSGVRWVRPEGIHLTLKFLGDMESTMIDRVMEGVESACKGTGPFELGLSEPGAFPSSKSPRVVWVGLRGELDLLERLQGRIDQEMHSVCGFPKERRAFTPHLTLGRMRENASGEERRRAGEALAKIPPENGVWWQVREVCLVRSTLTPSGAVYDILGSREL